MQTLTNLDDITKRLVPLTYFRRKAGEAFDKLPQLGMLIITKNGKPVAKLSKISNTETNTQPKPAQDLEKVNKVIGGFRLGRVSPAKFKSIILKRYDRVLS